MVTLRDILLYERLTGRPLLAISTERDVCALMYVTGEKWRGYSYGTFCKTAPQSAEFRAFAESVKADFAFASQFSKDETGEGGNIEKLTPTILTLAYSGINTDWLMRQPIETLPMLCDGYGDEQHRRAEDTRFWQLMQIGPHVSRSDYNRLKSSLKFPWERKAAQIRLTPEQEKAAAKTIFSTKIAFC